MHGICLRIFDWSACGCGFVGTYGSADGDVPGIKVHADRKSGLKAVVVEGIVLTQGILSSAKERVGGKFRGYWVGNLFFSARIAD